MHPDSQQNPYATPQGIENPPAPNSSLSSAVDYYRGMGWSGVLFFLLVYPLVLGLEYSHHGLKWESLLGITAWIGAMLLFFLLLLRTANRLEQDFQTSYRQARWLGILAAAFFFPVLTIPGIRAVRNLERHRINLQKTNGSL